MTAIRFILWFVLTAAVILFVIYLIALIRKNRSVKIDVPVDQ